MQSAQNLTPNSVYANRVCGFRPDHEPCIEKMSPDVTVAVVTEYLEISVTGNRVFPVPYHTLIKRT